jgi:hypothetical protein
MIRVSHIEEPELEFGGGVRHVDVRFGLIDNGPFDAGLETRPNEVRVGIIGSAETIDLANTWLERCKAGIEAKASKQPNLFPAFPGLGEDGAFRCLFSSPDRLQRTLRQKDLADVLARPSQPEIVHAAVELIASEVKELADETPPNVILIALPIELVTAVYVLTERQADDQVSGADSEPSKPTNFHGALKAACMRYRTPIQLVWPSTLDASAKIPRKIKKDRNVRVQDEATRAWNLTTALYYKAGGLPWRLKRDPRELRTSYVGISFFRSSSGDSVHTSTAQMFDERGEGLILRGGRAAEDSEDRRPHLTAEDAYDLLTRSLGTFRRQHGHYPARVVMHKTSNFNADEIDGFNRALDELDIDYGDYIYMAKSFIRLYRLGIYPPLRGTLIKFEPTQAVLYTKGSVEFFRTYPGLYVPKPVLLRAQRLGQPMTHIAEETLALSKMNWNNTQFDGGMPVTVVAAQQVGEILKYVEGDEFAPRYSFYM